MMMMPMMPMKVPFVMAPIAKRTTAMMRTMITHLPMPLLLLVLQGVIIAMLGGTSNAINDSKNCNAVGGWQ
jgi:hypothetical protein